MQILFTDTSPSQTRVSAALVNKGDKPAGLDPVLAEGAEASRFKGTAGQVFEGFASVDGETKRIALVGAGEKGADNRRLNLERAGGAVVAKYLRSGEEALVLDLGGAGLSADEAGAVLLGAKLRSWAHDEYRTKLAADKKISLTTIHVVGAPEGTEADWERNAAIARGVEFTKKLVTEPANIVYPESFGALCKGAVAGAGAAQVASRTRTPYTRRRRQPHLWRPVDGGVDDDDGGRRRGRVCGALACRGCRRRGYVRRNRGGRWRGTRGRGRGCCPRAGRL